MVKKLLALAMVGGGAYFLMQPGLRAFGQTGIPYRPDYSDGAFGESGVPFLPGIFPEDQRNHDLENGTLELGWLTDWMGGDGGGVSDILEPDWSIFDMTKPRGIRNNNPGNIEYTGTQWKGLDNPASDGRFMRFIAPEWGIRALARTLDTYHNTHGIDTVRGIINRWAPSFENNTGSYIGHVAQSVGVSADQPFDVNAKMPQLVRAIIQHENGEQPYSTALINKGISMA
jgi:hypothetical protein